MIEFQALQGVSISLRYMKISITDLLHCENVVLTLKHGFAF